MQHRLSGAGLDDRIRHTLKYAEYEMCDLMSCQASWVFLMECEVQICYF